jgi:hypothetical protein
MPLREIVLASRAVERCSGPEQLPDLGTRTLRSRASVGLVTDRGLHERPLA